MIRSAVTAPALMTLTAAPALAETTANAIVANGFTNNALTNNALANNALTNNGINRPLHTGAGSVLDVIALQLPSGATLSE